MWRPFREFRHLPEPVPARPSTRDRETPSCRTARHVRPSRSSRAPPPPHGGRNSESILASPAATQRPRRCRFSFAVVPVCVPEKLTQSSRKLSRSSLGRGGFRTRGGKHRNREATGRLALDGHYGLPTFPANGSARG